MTAGGFFRCAAAALLLAAAGPAPCARAQSDDPAFLKRIYEGTNGQSMRYRLFVPEHYDRQARYPVVLWLHGAAGRGSDNILQISEGNFLGTHIWTRPENQTRLPALVVAPQCPAGHFWGEPRGSALQLALEILDALEKEFSIDPDRVYLAGQSMGGEGTWEALLRAPGRFAAAIPLCGYPEPQDARRLAGTPVWIFQGEADPVVPVSGARRFVAALQRAGGLPRYTEYPGVGHQVWEKAFAEPDLVTWLAAQKRGH